VTHTFFKNVTKWVILVAIVLSVIELSCYFLFKIEHMSTYTNYEEVKNHFRKYNVDYDELRNELQFLYFDSILFSPYRWYSCTPNYNGKYIKTDGYGWRIDRSKISENVSKIACFGGSTMFSITEDTGTIPYHLNSRLNIDNITALNFGVGGYSSTTELMTLIEVLRYEKKIHYAVFYDGVNEVDRYIEFKQKHLQNKIYSCLGYPYPYGLDKAMRNHLNVIDVIDYYHSIHKPYVLRLLKELIIYRMMPKLIKSTQSITDYDKEAKTIANIYMCNVKDIAALCSANNIVPFFFLQPNIFTLNDKLLTAAEKNIIANTTQYSDVDPRKLMKAVYKEIDNRKELIEINFYDISDLLNSYPKDDYYIDDCHLYSNANKIVADRILAIIANFIPKNCIM
jgi:hypothetical protein